MKVQCPSCSVVVPVADLNVDTGWGKCSACDDLFPLADVVPGFLGVKSEAPTPRPFNARAVVERTPEQLLVHVRAEGMRASTVVLLLFACVWLAFITFWTAGALGMFGMFAAGGKQPRAENWLFAAFSIPFWLAGFGMLAGVAWKAWATRAVRITRGEMTTQMRCVVWSRVRSIPFQDVQHARPYVPELRTEGVYPVAVEIVYRNGSFVLPADSDDEQQWLIGEVNGFVASHAA